MTLKRYVLAFFPGLFLSYSMVMAQVPAQVSAGRMTADSVSIFQVSWSEAEEQEWLAANRDRLDLMGVRVDLGSAQLTKYNNTRFQLRFDHPVRMELLANITYRHEGEALYLVDLTTGRTIVDLMQRDEGRILCPPFDPDKTILIWEGRRGESRQSRFTLGQMYIGDARDRQLDIGFGTALACHPNASCKTDSLMELISRSVVRMRLVMEEGVGWCTGTFINNTRQDLTPYVLSAFHCQYDYTPLYDMWRFDLEYASSTCENPLTEPAFMSLTGCQYVAGGQGSDFLLLRLADPVPVNMHVTFAGWDRDETIVPDTVFHIHHPNADIRKFSTCTTGIVIHPNQIGWSEGYTTPPQHHLRFKFTEGGHEPGSSGGPVFNTSGHIVAQLHGGTAGCEATNSTFAGRLARSWELGDAPDERLRDWLDPDDTGLLHLTGIENVGESDLVDLEGLLKDPLGRPIGNAMVRIQGALEDTLITGPDGRFSLAGINRNGQYTITPLKNNLPLNGINALDLVGIQKHLLAKDTFDFAWQHIAADPTNGGTITVGDIVMVLKLLLGQTQMFPTSPSWRFIPASMTVGPLPAGQPVQLEMTGIKIGDVNGTSDPQQ